MGPAVPGRGAPAPCQNKASQRRREGPPPYFFVWRYTARRISSLIKSTFNVGKLYVSPCVATINVSYSPPRNRSTGSLRRYLKTLDQSSLLPLRYFTIHATLSSLSPSWPRAAGGWQDPGAGGATLPLGLAGGAGANFRARRGGQSAPGPIRAGQSAPGPIRALRSGRRAGGFKVSR